MENLNNLFVKPVVAESLKLKGFDDCCFGYYENNKLDPKCPKLILNFNNTPLTIEQSKRPGMWLTEHRNSKLPQWATAAPTCQQIIDWFRKKYNVIIEISLYYKDSKDSWVYEISEYGRHRTHFEINKNKTSKTYYQAYNKAIKEALKLI